MDPAQKSWYDPQLTARWESWHRLVWLFFFWLPIVLSVEFFLFWRFEKGKEGKKMRKKYQLWDSEFTLFCTSLCQVPLPFGESGFAEPTLHPWWLSSTLKASEKRFKIGFYLSWGVSDICVQCYLSFHGFVCLLSFIPWARMEDGACLALSLGFFFFKAFFFFFKAYFPRSSLCRLLIMKIR